MRRAALTRRLAGIAAGCLAAAASAAAAGPADWRAYADCAAAYRANAQLSDPDRPASMTAQISEVAADYAREAARRLAHPASKAAARRAAEARIAGQAKRLAGQSRAAVEKLIDACPQIDG